MLTKFVTRTLGFGGPFRVSGGGGGDSIIIVTILVWYVLTMIQLGPLSLRSCHDR